MHAGRWEIQGTRQQLRQVDRQFGAAPRQSIGPFPDGLRPLAYVHIGGGGGVILERFYAFAQLGCEIVGVSLLPRLLPGGGVYDQCQTQCESGLQTAD